MNSGSKPSSLRALAGPRVRFQAIARVPSGSPAVLHLSNPIHDLDAPGTALILAERGLSLRSAHAIVTRLFDEGNAVVDIPTVESLEVVTAALAECGVEATPYGSPDRIDVRAIRSALAVSQEEFALRFGLELSSVRNWEQGRSQPDTATRSFLLMIRTHPDTVRETLRDHGRQVAAE